MLDRKTTSLEQTVDLIKATTARLSLAALGYTPRHDRVRQHLAELREYIKQAESKL